MKKTSLVFVFTIICFFAGALFFLIQRKWLIVQWTFNTEPSGAVLAKKETILKKDIIFYWWEKEMFHTEKATLIWRHDENDNNIKQVINNWLGCLKNKKILEPVLMIESVILSPTGQEVFISFNQAFTWKEWSIHKKLMLIEGLCKTLKNIGLPLKFITFLVNHESMIDDHLDFAHPWSVDGFVEEQ